MASHTPGDDRGLLTMIAVVIVLILAAAVLWAHMTSQVPEPPSAGTPTVIEAPAVPAEPATTDTPGSDAATPATKDG